MTTNHVEQGQPPEEASAPGTGPPGAAQDIHPALKALPPRSERADSGQPGGGRGRVDVTGIIPEGIRVDPYITEGHPGYEESGDSEIIPTERLSGGEAAEGKESPG